MTGEERAILMAAQDKAIDILSASRAEANRIIGDAQAKAVALLIEQQQRAEDLLRQQRAEVASGGLLTDDADVLLEQHKRAAELLASSEQEAATKLRETRASEAVDVLMAGQREAAAILLDAWMKVTEGRPSAENRPG